VAFLLQLLMGIAARRLSAEDDGFELRHAGGNSDSGEGDSGGNHDGFHFTDLSQVVEKRS